MPAFSVVPIGPKVPLALKSSVVYNRVEVLKNSLGGFMFRVGLIAYLSLATVFAPFLCCCSAPNLTRLFGNRPHFSNDGSEQVLAKDGKLAGKRSVGRASCCQRQSSDDGSSKPDGTPCRDSGGTSCPCGKRQATVAAENANDVPTKIVEVNNPLWDLSIANLSSDRDFEITVLSAGVHEKPAGIYGRELLRAFQIMRC